MKSPLINILTRTSNRPEEFTRCVESVRSQSYKNIRHIVCADNDESFEYASKLVKDPIRVQKRDLVPLYKNYEPYNLYINDLLKEVKGGYIMFLDDDDYLSSPRSIEKIVPHLHKDEVLCWLTNLGGVIIPNKQSLLAPVLIPTQIGNSSFMFHSMHKWAAKQDAVRGADYRCVQRLSWLLKHTWLEEVLVIQPIARGGL